MLPKLPITATVLGLASAMAQAEEGGSPKLGEHAMHVTAETTYLRLAPAPDYWAFTHFVKPQITESACSVAAVTAALNGLRGVPEQADQPIMTQDALLDLVGGEWGALSAQDGDGVTFDQLAQFTRDALTATGMDAHQVTALRPKDESAETRAEIHAMLEANEETAQDAMLVYFNQGVITGDWDGPHVALIGAYDLLSERVLILEVDQEWYIPYWTTTNKLIEAMLKPAPEEHGPLGGETGGLVLIHPAATED